jgi:hypothetical protein
MVGVLKDCEAVASKIKLAENKEVIKDESLNDKFLTS